MKETLRKARTAIYINKDPDEGVNILLPYEKKLDTFSFVQKREFGELMGYAYQRKHCFDDATRHFKSIGDNYQAGYSQLLKGDINRARAFWQAVAEKRADHWAVFLYGFATVTLQSMPSYLQLRNHLEADIGHLLWAKQLAYIDNIARYADFMAEVNYESYKFIGRAFLHAGYFEQAEPFLLKGQKLLPNDPEVYFHLGQYSRAQGHDDQCMVLLNQCLQMCPTYTPAKALRQEILSPA